MPDREESIEEDENEFRRVLDPAARMPALRADLTLRPQRDVLRDEPRLRVKNKEQKAQQA